MSIKCAISLAVLFCVFPARAQDVEKNGLPCVAEICIGDGIAELRKVSWDRAKNMFSSPDKPLYTAKRKLDEADFRTVRSQYRGDTGVATPYLADGQFDSESLDALSRVSAACTSSELTGTYTTKSGNPTRVTIALTPGMGSTAVQRWTVIKLLRTIPAAVTQEQRTQSSTELSARYKAFDLLKSKNAKPGEARFSMAGNGATLFGFQFFLFQGLEEADHLKQHPLCGGAAKVKVD